MEEGLVPVLYVVFDQLRLCGIGCLSQCCRSEVWNKLDGFIKKTLTGVKGILSRVIGAV